MFGNSVQMKMWTVVVCSFFVGVLANGNKTADYNSVLKKEVIVPPIVFPNNSTEIKVNETARNILQPPLHEEKNVTFSEANLTDVSEVPIVFPTNSSDVKSYNETIAKILLHSNTSAAPLQPTDQSSTKITQNVMSSYPTKETIFQRLNHSSNTSAATIQPTDQSSTETVQNQILFSPITTSHTDSNKPKKHNPKEDSEWIQKDGENSEDELHPFLGRKDLMGSQRNHGLGVPLVRGQLAAILAGIFVVLAVGGYIALLSWRRYLENRYGNREMLVNEEEMSEATDMKYFSVSKL